MNYSQALSIRLREVLLDGKWIANTNFKAQITNVTWQQATFRVGNLNTIALLTFHINYYLQGLNDAFESGKLEIRDKYSFNATPINSEEDWQNLIDSFITNAERFIKQVAKLDETKLDEPFIDPMYGDYHRNIEGMIEHTYYHLGQISLIRKLIEG